MHRIENTHDEETNMRELRTSTLVASTGSWVCRRCLRGRRKLEIQSAFFGTKGRNIHVTRSAVGGTRLAAATAGVTGLGVGSFFLTPDGIKGSAEYTYDATARTGRVLTTLTTCIDE